MAWLDADDIRQKFNIASQKYTTQIEAAIASAALMIRQSVSSEIYDQAVDGTLPTDDAELIRAQSVIESHSFLTMWFLVGNVGNKLGDAGFIKQAQDTGSPANAQTITNQYLTPKELAEMRAGFFENAQIAIRPYGSLDVTEDVAEAETGYAVSSLNWF